MYMYLRCNMREVLTVYMDSMVKQTNTQEHPTPRYLSVNQTCIAQRSVLAEVDMFSSSFFLNYH